MSDLQELWDRINEYAEELENRGYIYRNLPGNSGKVETLFTISRELKKKLGKRPKEDEMKI